MKRLFFLLLFLLIALSSCGDAFTPTSPIGTIASPTSSPQPNTLPYSMAIGKTLEYALPQANSGLMRPAIDHKGRIWFGEMNRNLLGVFDPATGKFQQFSPPHGKFGIMGVVAATDDTIWFAEQYADYIGHFLPATSQFQVYPLPTTTAPDPSNPGKTLTLPSAPNDLTIDKQGNVWFTEMNASTIGELHPSNGSIQHFPLPAQKNKQSLNPYGIAIDARGKIWFTTASNSFIGELNPSNGQIRQFTAPNLSNSLMEIASAPDGTIWATGFNAGLLLQLNPGTGTFTNYYAPSLNGDNTGGLYGIAITSTDQVWLTIPAINVIAHLDMNAHRFIYYSISTANSLPLGIVIGQNNTFWFTEAGSDKIGMLSI